MKILLTIAAALAAVTSVSPAAAHDRGPGRWEWQNRPVAGPNKSNLPTRVRVWVADSSTMANCDCPMMHGTATSGSCMEKPPLG